MAEKKRVVVNIFIFFILKRENVCWNCKKKVNSRYYDWWTSGLETSRNNKLLHHQYKMTSGRRKQKVPTRSLNFSPKYPSLLKIYYDFVFLVCAQKTFLVVCRQNKNNKYFFKEKTNNFFFFFFFRICCLPFTSSDDIQIKWRRQRRNSTRLRSFLL